MREAGLSQTALADAVGVSKQSVSNWSRGAATPRPQAVLALSLALGVQQHELFSGDSPAEPRVSYRLKAKRKARDPFRAETKRSVRYLNHLVPFLPDQLCQSGYIRHPALGYDHVQSEAAGLRRELGIGVGELEVSFFKIVAYIRNSGAVIIPVPWGATSHPVNGIHVFLPDSRTNWLYVNVDTPILDAKFWLVHEIAHMLTPALDPDPDEAEKYADAFAGAVLFPKNAAEQLYRRLRGLDGDGQRVNHLKRLAKMLVVSPLTLYLEANNYARWRGKPEIDLANSIYGAAANVRKNTPTLSELLFSSLDPDAGEYVERCAEVFQTPFFKAMTGFILEKSKGSGLVARLLRVPAVDAMAIYGALKEYGTMQGRA